MDECNTTGTLTKIAFRYSDLELRRHDRHRNVSMALFNHAIGEFTSIHTFLQWGFKKYN